MSNIKDFSSILKTLQTFWESKGCSIVMPYDTEVGAGTFHPLTVLKCLDKKDWNIAYPQACRRPTDGRYGESPNRLQHYYQFQVLMKPAPSNIQQLYLESLEALGISTKVHDIRFIEDDWESPTLGAWGLGWEVWCDGMEISQFTYFQQVGGITCESTPVEITYGLERISMYILDVDNVYDMYWNKDQNLKYGDVFLESEKQFSEYNFHLASTERLISQFDMYEKEFEELTKHNVPYPAYHVAILASNIFNILDARGLISVGERALYIQRIRTMVNKSCQMYLGIK